MPQESDLLIHFERQVGLMLTTSDRVEYELERTGSDLAQCMILDAFTEMRAARIMLQASGMCDVEVIDAATSDQLVYKHHENLGVSDIVELLDSFKGSLNQ